MVYLYKYGGRKCCYDSVSGAVISLSSLQYKMMGTLEAPLPPVCPTSLRYELAKFDSDDVSEAYDELYGLFKDGTIYAEGDSETAALQISGDCGATEADEAKLLFSLAYGSGAKKYRLIGRSELESIIREAAANAGLTE